MKPRGVADGACDTHGDREKYIQVFDGGKLKEGISWENYGACGRKILKFKNGGFLVWMCLAED
jgi:hypothetical protein